MIVFFKTSETYNQVKYKTKYHLFLTARIGERDTQLTHILKRTFVKTRFRANSI